MMKNYIIPVFIPHYGCKNNCVFCNQHKITGVETDVTAEKIKKTIEYHLARMRDERYVEVAFYGGSFTALSLEKQASFLSVANVYLSKRMIDGIRLSTRPDCIDEQTLDQLIAYGVKTIEIGVQAFDDEILHRARRGHTVADIESAVRLIRDKHFVLGIQVMPGLPGDTWLTMMRTMAQVIRQRPHFVRIYPTIVLEHTALADLYRGGEYRPLALAAAVRYSMVMKQEFEKNGIKVIRTGLQATENLADPKIVLAGPYHPSFGELVESYRFYICIARLLEQLPLTMKTLTIYHHPADTSKIRGNKNGNTLKWMKTYRLKHIFWKADPTCGKQVVIAFGGQKYIVSSTYDEGVD